jgi:preprotein translocase subunit SecG
MSLFAGFLTFVLLANCLLLILLVLVQLPKKDAGAGLAFGSGAADALFGAGSGNMLTKITKYATVAFLLLALLLGYVEEKASNANNGANFLQAVQQKAQQQAATMPAPAPTTAPAQAQPAPTAPSGTIPAGISGAAASATNSAK